jgi:hypothetical protein
MIYCQLCRFNPIFAVAMLIGAALMGADCAAGAEPPPKAVGIATKYPDDVGIAKDPRVVFADNFDAWETDSGKVPSGTWDDIRNSKDARQRQTLAVAGAVSVAGKEIPGVNVLMLACWNGSPNTAGLRKHLGNYRNQQEGKGKGYEEIFIRYYQKLDASYKPERNHGSNLGGRDLTQPGSWSVGRADTRDVAAQGYFFSGLQPYDIRRQQLYWGFYSYHMDKPDQWGDSYRPKPEERKAIEVGRWYCLERHMKLNSVEPLKADGLEELWVDGELAIRREGLRFRRVPELRITVFELEVYYHGLPKTYTEEKSAKVYFDNVVVATERIGCLSPAKR